MTAIHESFLRHRGYRHLKLALVLCAACIAAYAWHDPHYGPNGGTWLGYTLGTLATLIVLLLCWFGVRKRRYRSRAGTVKGWLSAHVYLGLSLLVIATLHAAFQVGWNVHTLAYVLMCLVIASGIYGMVAYAHYPAEITANLEQTTADLMLDQVMELNQQGLKLADELGPEVHRVMLRSSQNVRIGGGLAAQLFGLREPRSLVEELKGLLAERELKLQQSSMQFDPNAGGTVTFMAGQLGQMRAPGIEADKARQLLDLLTRRNELLARLNRDIRKRARMQVWLMLHVPLSIALLAALVVHITAVFMYW